MTFNLHPIKCTSINVPRKLELISLHTLRTWVHVGWLFTGFMIASTVTVLVSMGFEPGTTEKLFILIWGLLAYNAVMSLILKDAAQRFVKRWGRPQV